MEEVIKSLTPDQKQEFFFRDLDLCRKSIKSREMSRISWQTFCGAEIVWTGWNKACRRYGLELVDFPYRYYSNNLSKPKGDKLIEAIKMLLSTKTTKTFEDLL